MHVPTMTNVVEERKGSGDFNTVDTGWSRVLVKELGASSF